LPDLIKEYDFTLKENSEVAAVMPIYNEETQQNLLVGLYRKAKENVISGIFIGEMKLEENTQKEFQYYPIELPIDWEYLHYVVSDMIFLNNGNTHVLFSNTRLSISSDGGQGISSKTHSGNQILITVDKTGELLNQKLIHRKSVSDYNRINHRIFHQNGMIYLLFDSRLSETDRSRLNVKLGKMWSLARLLKIDSEGKEIYEKIVFPPKQRENYFYYHVFATMHDNTISLIGGKMSVAVSKNHQFRFGRVGL
jgi:hypothetical protein